MAVTDDDDIIPDPDIAIEYHNKYYDIAGE